MLVTLGRFGFSPQMADLVQNAKSGFARKIVGLFSEADRKVSVEWWFRWWEFFYRGFFKYNLDVSGLFVPESRKGFDCLLVLAEPAISQPLFDKSSEYFPCWKIYGGNLDEAVAEHERDPRKGAYAIWVEDTQEPSKRLKNISADKVREMKLATETLPERLLHGLVYHLGTGQHLDVENTTYCAGSRDYVGGIPSVRWDGGGLGVHGCPPSHAHDSLRPREVVS
ncbi:MAG: hypothetical protein HYW15_00135 [Candidatus Giovannonibacteria bacterium]|nr:MAG: hypothetical protein HYW15_00135 [Candidatus Giovannonibacteria bacterium]